MYIGALDQTTPDVSYLSRALGAYLGRRVLSGAPGLDPLLSQTTPPPTYLRQTTPPPAYVSQTTHPVEHWVD